MPKKMTLSDKTDYYVEELCVLAKQSYILCSALTLNEEQALLCLDEAYEKPIY